jgi:hypothetical protein
MGKARALAQAGVLAVMTHVHAALAWALLKARRVGTGRRRGRASVGLAAAG